MENGNSKKKYRLHLMDVDTMIVFYEVCIEFKVKDDDFQTKQNILLELAKFKKMTIWETNRPLDQTVKDFSKHFKTVYIKGKEEV